ncbi:MAG: Sec-independent protein translocase protein TatB [Gammaproteobacteria bacterium]|nr:Sec-independent protein translocase protein TatB [Gammaproteobacteria bacterium]
MFDVGFWELVLIGIVALLVVGPERLPRLAHTLGLWLGKARRLVDSVKAEIEQELHLEEAKRLVNESQLSGLDPVLEDVVPNVVKKERVASGGDAKRQASSKRSDRRARGRSAKTSSSDAGT